MRYLRSCPSHSSRSESEGNGYRKDTCLSSPDAVPMLVAIVAAAVDVRSVASLFNVDCWLFWRRDFGVGFDKCSSLSFDVQRC